MDWIKPPDPAGGATQTCDSYYLADHRPGATLPHLTSPKRTLLVIIPRAQIAKSTSKGGKKQTKSAIIIDHLFFVEMIIREEDTACFSIYVVIPYSTQDNKKNTH